MKRILLIQLFCILGLLAGATQRTVNNNNNLPNNPGQFTTISAAITASNPGDTILVAGSPINYTNTLTVSKKLVILGPGYSPDKQNPLTATITGNINLSANSASGFVIMGFILNSTITFPSGTNIDGATIRRNQFVGGYIDFADSTTNVLVAENVWSSGYIQFYTTNNQANLIVTNNLFTNNQFAMVFEYTPGTNYLPVTITHNIFMYGTVSNPLISSGWQGFLDGNSYNLVIENNIFYNISPQPSNSSTTTNSTFDHNISYSGGTLPTMPLANNVGSGNLNNQDPEEVTIFSTASSLNFSQDNLRLQSGSQAHNAGTDGTDIGPTGGAYPVYVSTNRYLTGEPPIPEVKSANFSGPSSVAPGGSLQIQISATKIN